MEMTLATNCSSPGLLAKLLILACLFWPFIAASFLSRRSTSAGPMAAVLVPLALSVSGMLMGLYRALEGMSISGGGRAAVSAGIAEALMFLRIGAFFAVIVLIVAAIRRHRPFVDRLTAALFALLVAETIGALFLAANIGKEPWQLHACLIGASIAALTAVVAAVWTFRTGRGRATSQPIPYAVIAFVATSILLGVFIREATVHYMMIAMGR
jgi:hypothetical protein